MAKDLIIMLLINTFDYFYNIHLKIIARIITLYQDIYSFSWWCYSCSVMSDSLQPHGHMDCQGSLSFTISQSLHKLVSIKLSDAIQPSHPLSFPSPVFNLSQYQGSFQWVSSSHQVARVLELQFQHQSF